MRWRMGIEIDILNGEASWHLAETVFETVWPAETLEKLAWVTSFGPTPICAR